MALKRNAKDGSFSVTSKSAVRAALDRIAELEEAIAAVSGPLSQERDALRAGLDKYVIDNFDAGEGFHDDEWRATKVVGKKRTWDVEKLEKLIPRGVFKNVTKTAVDSAKIDEYVSTGKLNVKVIAPAFTETPNKPYVKVTKVTASVQKGEAEADSLAAKLG